MYLRHHGINNGQILRRKYKLTRDPRLIRFGIDCGFFITVLFGDLKLTIHQKGTGNYGKTIFSFKSPYYNKNIEYKINIIETKTRFKSYLDYLEEIRDHYYPDLLLVSQYMSEEDFGKIFTEETGKLLRTQTFSRHFEGLVNVMRDCVVKPNNYRELLRVYLGADHYYPGQIISKEEIEHLINKENA